MLTALIIVAALWIVAAVAFAVYLAVSRSADRPDDDESAVPAPETVKPPRIIDFT